MDTNVLLNLKRGCQMKRRMPKAVYNKEFREQAVKQVTEEGLSANEAARRLSLPPLDLGEPGKSGKGGQIVRNRQDATPADRDRARSGKDQTGVGRSQNGAWPIKKAAYFGKEVR